MLPALPALSSAAGTAAVQGGGGIGRAILAEILGNLIVNRGPQAVAGIAENIAGPTDVGTAGFKPAGKYFLGTEAPIGYEQFLSREAPRRAVINYIAGVFGQPPIFAELPSTEQFINSALERQLLQARDLTAREIEKIRAEKEYDYLARGLEAQAGVRKQELSSLGDIQRQRVSSSYSAAQNLLSDAIKNMASREDLANSAVLKQLATPV